MSDLPAPINPIDPVNPIQQPREKIEKFSLDQSIGTGWKKTWANFWPFCGICTATFLLGSIPTICTYVVTWVNGSTVVMVISAIVALIGLLLTQIIQLGYCNLQLRVLDDKPILTKDVFAVSERIWPFIGASLLYGMACGAGFICLIVPGIIFHLKFQFYPYFVLEYKMGPLQALRASWTATKDIKMDLFLFGIVQWFINSVGTMLFLVGTFPAWIINGISLASVYRQIVRNTPELQSLTPVKIEDHMSSPMIVIPEQPQ